MIRFVLPAIFLLSPLLTAAQRYYPTGVQSREIISLQAGTTSFYGDLEGTTKYIDSNPHLGLSYEYQLLPHLGIRGSLLWYQIKASDAKAETAYLRDRNLSFTASNWEISALAALYLLPYRPALFQDRKKFNLYGLVGVGLTLYKPKAEYGGELHDLRSLQTEGVRYGKTALVVPFGGGVQVKLSPQLDLAVEATYHYCFTDYLDDVSTTYRDPNSFEGNEIAASLADRRPEVGLPKEAAGAIRGNPVVKDAYSMVSLRANYYLVRYRYRGRVIKRLYQ